MDLDSHTGPILARGPPSLSPRRTRASWALPSALRVGTGVINSVTSSIEICRNPIIVIQCGLMATHGSFINRIGGREPVVISEVFCRFD